jgi:uncharacterized protein (UPF0276 family)
VSVPRLGLPDLGFGVGLRAPHVRQFLDEKPSIDWLEAISENHFEPKSRARRALEQLSERYPIVLHGVALSIGSCDPIDEDYLDRLDDLIRAVRPIWISDHLCWTGVAGRTSHDLLPLPRTRQTLDHVVSRVQQVQERLGRPLVLENPSTYLEFTVDEMGEAEFLGTIAERADCGILLDVNNVHVASRNHGFDARDYLERLPVDRIVQLHLSGHTDCGSHLLDTHDCAVADPVWALYRHARERFGSIPTLIEWDAQIPPLSRLLAEVDRARTA